MLEKWMAKAVPVWLVAALMIFVGLGTVLFGTLVLRASMAGDEGFVSRTALSIAKFPATAKQVVETVTRQLTGQVDLKDITGVLPDVDLAAYTPVKAKGDFTLTGLVLRQGEGAAPGWRVLVGPFQIDGRLQHAALLLNPALQAVHYWPLREGEVEGVLTRPPLEIFPHGFALLPDQSIIFSYDGGHTLTRRDKCGQQVWAAPGRYHHAVTLNEAGTLAWAIRTADEKDRAMASQLVAVNTADGSIAQTLSMADVIAANPDIDVLEVRRLHANGSGGNARAMKGRWLDDPFHLNDVEPLGASMAALFPQFAVGDLLVSARELNLVFVVDPATAKIKWWRVGATIRQHDPDFAPTGLISVFDNRMGREFSAIAGLDVETLAFQKLVDGAKLDFYSRIRGKHQWLPGGGVLITAAQQARVLELAADGTVALEFLNFLDADATHGVVVSEALWRPLNTFADEDFLCD